MSKESTRRELSYCFLNGLRRAIKTSPEAEVVMVQVNLVNNPDYCKCASFGINFIES